MKVLDIILCVMAGMCFQIALMQLLSGRIMGGIYGLVLFGAAVWCAWVKE